jgi:hypothetical protein
MNAVILCLVVSVSGLAQTPAGVITGIVRDPAGAAITGAEVGLLKPATGFARRTTTSEEGLYSFPALSPGEYQLSVEVAGFQELVKSAVVNAGETTLTDFVLQLGNVTESITVDAVTSEMHYDSHTVADVVTREQIEDLPLNGRAFVELAKLEPGVQPPSRASNNRTFVPVLGTPFGNSGRGTRITVDGGSIMALGNGGSALGLSQDVVEEFQITTSSFDLSTGPTIAGSINVVTRSGTNNVHGNAFYFFRDHHAAAYPALNRDPADADPFFQRRQFGFAIGGPIRHDKLFLFGNWERNEQRGVDAATIVTPDFAQFSRVTPSPFFGNQFSLRMDGRISAAHTAFIRYSHDGNRAFGPSTLNAAGPASYPSIWTKQTAWADQSLLGLTSNWSSRLVNDLRFSYFFISSKEVAPGTAECPGCLGIGAPAINVAQTDLKLGLSSFSFNLARRFHLNNLLTWQTGAHRIRYGAEWEHDRGEPLTWTDEPVTMTLYSPKQARQKGIPTPASFRTLDDILQLPLQTISVAVGDPRVPQEDGSSVRKWDTLRIFFQDAWRLSPQLTVNYGLGWSIDRNLNYDLAKPALLAPILGADQLGPTRKQWKDFSPVLGGAWTPSTDRKTVIRAGGGIFYDFQFGLNLDAERAALGPAGEERQTFPGSSIGNPVPGIPGVPVGRPLDFSGSTGPTFFTGANLMSALPVIRGSLLQTLAGSDRSVPPISVTKTFPGVGLSPMNVPRASSLHANVGVQRQVGKDFVVSADFIFRHFIHLGIGNVDLNHFRSVRGPVIRTCAGSEAHDPQALCSNGSIDVAELVGRATYRGLAVRVERRFSRRLQFLASWAYSSNTGTSGAGVAGFNLDNWLQNRGPLSTDLTHIVNLSGVAHLPRRFELGLNFSYTSSPPLSASLTDIDFDGDDSKSNALLPGTTFNAFNRGLGRADLVRLVTQFNQNYAGRTDAQGRPIHVLTLPDHYSLGHHFQSLDLRLSRSYSLGEHSRVSVIGEVFNLYNAANLMGYSGDLTSAAFGQPTGRFNQVFGSGGPRAFQVATKVSF